jgi:hypothetical protein
MSNSDANTVEPISRRGTLLGIAGAAAGSIAAVSSSNAFATQSLALPPTTSGVSPFAVRIPQAQLIDLKRRLAATRWPERERTKLTRGADPGQLRCNAEPIIEQKSACAFASNHSRTTLMPAFCKSVASLSSTQSPANSMARRFSFFSVRPIISLTDLLARLRIYKHGILAVDFMLDIEIASIRSIPVTLQRKPHGLIIHVNPPTYALGYHSAIVADDHAKKSPLCAGEFRSLGPGNESRHTSLHHYVKPDVSFRAPISG